MKTRLAIGCIAVLGAGLTTAGAADQEGRTLKDQKEKRSYALGVEVGNTIRDRLVEVDQAVLFQGIKDALSGGSTLLSGGELSAILADLQADVKRKLDAAEAEKVLAENKLAEKNRREGEAFLASNRTKEGVVPLQSGLQYKVLKAGDGKKPSADDTVLCNYRGTFADGKVFTDSYRSKQPLTLPLGRVIKGLKEGLQLMPVGSKYQLFVPSHLAYGSRSMGPLIGPNATLVFEVELLEIMDKSSASAAAPDPRDALIKAALASKQQAAAGSTKPASASPAP